MFFGIIMIKNILEGRFLMTDRNKDTNATASAFGWDFQYNLALYLVMDQDLRQVEKFKVEGSTEDIEIYFRNKEPIYIQAKSQENPHSKSTTTQHLTNAINSLINAVSKVNEEYSEVIYGNNIEIPIRANKKIIYSKVIESREDIRISLMAIERKSILLLINLKLYLIKIN